jgi:hypothetical protein
LCSSAFLFIVLFLLFWYWSIGVLEKAMVIVGNTFRLTRTAGWQADSLNEGLRPLPPVLPAKQ